MSDHRLDGLIDRARREVRYKNWSLESEGVYTPDGDRLGSVVFFEFLAEDNMQPGSTQLFPCRTRRWFVPVAADWTDLVNTLWLAVEIGERHESMELFTLGGAPVRDPHTRLEQTVVP